MLQAVALLAFVPVDGVSLLLLASGLFQGAVVPCYALIVREYFPASEAGVTIGVVVFATLIGMAFGGWASGL